MDTVFMYNTHTHTHAHLLLPKTDYKVFLLTFSSYWFCLSLSRPLSLAQEEKHRSFSNCPYVRTMRQLYDM